MAWRGWLLAAAVFAGPAAAGTTDDLIYIHDSTGAQWLDHSLRAALAAKAHVDEVHDVGAGIDLAPDAGRPASLAPTPGDLTAMHHWILWFNDYLAAVKSHGCADGVNRIVVFGSGFTASDVTADGAEPGDPFGAERSVTNYQAVFRHPSGPGNTYTHGGHIYRPLEDVFAANPDTLFIVLTPPPLCEGCPGYVNGDRSREFGRWLMGQWLDGYQAAHPGLDNVAVFDWFGLMATSRDWLKEEYDSGAGDSYPNSQGYADSTAAFAGNAANFVDTAWRAFTTDAPLTLYVDDDNTSGIEDGSAAYPFNTIQEGIDAAVDGDTVVVADGMYQGDGNRDLDYKGKAITVTSENGPSHCIVDCESYRWSEFHCGFLFRTAEGPDSVLHGLTITRGFINYGGGICCDGASPRITGCVLRFNYGNATGGGIACLGASPTIEGNVILGNRAYFSGAGIACLDGSHPVIRGNVIAGNAAPEGAGICFGNDATPTIDHNTICYNWAYQGHGGGICVRGLSATTISNCILWGNVSLGEGDQIGLWDAWFTPPGSQPATVTVEYSNVQGGEAGLFIDDGCTVVWGAGNIDADPHFAAAGQWDEHGTSGYKKNYNDTWTPGDAHVRSPAGRYDPALGQWLTLDAEMSPCIDAGDPATPVGDEPSPNGGLVNMGAYGGTAEASKTPPRVHDYYVNDASTANDQYCSAVGNDANDGLSPAHPKRTLHAVVASYDLGPGDTIWVDTGIYVFASSGLVVGADDGGEEGAPMRIIGSPHPDGTRIEGASRPVAIALDNCRHVWLEQLRIFGADTAVGIAAPAPDAPSLGCVVRNCTLDGNHADGLVARYAHGCAVLGNRIAGNSGHGIYAEGCNELAVVGNVVWSNGGHGLAIEGGQGAEVEANTIAANAGHQLHQFQSDASPLPVAVQHNILWAAGAGTQAIRRDGGPLRSDYNDLYATDGAHVGYDGVACPTLAGWQAASGQDANSISADPLFADAATGDVHLQSEAGRYDPTTGSWATDPQTSLCIDAGEPHAPFTAEPEPNGFWRNLGAYGNTAEASMSPAPPRHMAVESPNGGELWRGGQLITWRPIGAGFEHQDTVTIEYSPDLGTTWLPVLAPNGNDSTGTGYGRGRVGFVWDTTSAQPNRGDTFLIRVTSDQVPSLTDTSDQPFTLLNGDLPTLIAIEPAYGPPGSLGVLTAANAGAAGAVKFTPDGGSATDWTVTAWSDSQITFEIPASTPPGPGQVAIIRQSDGATSNALPFTVTDPATVRPPGTLDFDLRVLVGGRLNLKAPGSRSVSAETLDANGNPPEARYAIRVEGLGWLVVAGDTASPEGADPDFQPLSVWEGIRVLGLLAGTDYTFWAVAKVGDDESPAVAVGAFRTNRACDVNRSGVTTALDYAYIRAATLRGGTLGLDISWACDVTGNGGVGVDDLNLTRDAILHP